MSQGFSNNLVFLVPGVGGRLQVVHMPVAQTILIDV
jgi:hypothetical protein